MNVTAALTHLFIPHESNNHRARLLQLPVLLALLVIFVISQQEVHTVQENVLGYASQISTTEVIQLTNQKRVENGLSSLNENADLDRAAKAKGQDMLAKGYWAHVAPDGTQPWDFFKAVGYKYRYAGENLARDFTNPTSAVDAWMASPSHRENMLSDRYKEIGVAVVDGSLNGKDATIIVQLFGTTMTTSPQIPQVAAAEKQVLPATKNETQPTTAPAVPNVKEVTQLAQVPSTSQVPNYSQIFSLAVIAVMLVALVVDAFVLWIKGIRRVGSRSLAQIAFLGMIFAIIIVARAGQIL